MITDGFSLMKAVLLLPGVCALSVRGEHSGGDKDAALRSILFLVEELF